ncbi:MAG: chloride channel protein [Planctomycetes bacterium]|nr:chloride channel protein [Planctomycetota bacterium]
MTIAAWRSRLIRWLLAHPTGRWVVLAGGVGLLCGVVAAVFEVGTDLVGRWLLEGICGLPSAVAATHPAMPTLTGDLALLPLLGVLTGGGLLAGLVIQHWCAAARGGGTGVAVQAFHQQRGIIPPAIPWAKFAASILSLGSGGSGGREGPISLIGAGIGSWFGARMRLTPRDRRILLAAGIAGGISAVFHAPLAAAIFAAEVLYLGPDMEADVLIPAFISAIIGYLAGTMGAELLGPLVGLPGVEASTLFQPPVVAFHVGDWMQLAGFTLVALAATLAARLLIALVQRANSGFARMPLPVWVKPGIGALASGLVATCMYFGAALVLGGDDEARLTLGTVGGGYGILQWLFASGAGTQQHHVAMAALLGAVAVGKSLTTALTAGSGGSVGLFGPSIVIGGCTGGAVGFALAGLPIGPPPAACILMGMAGVLAATHRTPVAALLMVSEIAGTWLLLLPAMWVSGLAFLLTGHRSLIGGQVVGIHDSPAHRSHLLRDVLAHTTVREILGTGRAWVAIPARAGIEACRTLVLDAHQEHFPVIRDDGCLVGMIDRLEIVRMVPDPLLSDMVLAADLASGAGMALHPEDTLSDALRRIHQQGMEELPVVDGAGAYLGMLTSGMVMEHYRAAMERAHSERSAEGFAHERGQT